MFNWVKKLFKKPALCGGGVIGPDKPDERDWEYKKYDSHEQILSGLAGIGEPEEFMFDRSYLGGILNQGMTNSCTGHGSATLANIMISRTLNAPDNYNVNPFYIYWHARQLGGLGNEDCGAYVRDAMKALQKYGAARLSYSNPYRAPIGVDVEKTFKIKDYQRIWTGDIAKMKYALAVEKLPILISFNVINADIDNYTGIVAGKNTTAQSSGYHCVVLIGFKKIDGELYFIAANSWGRAQGDGGLYYIHESYFKSSYLAPDIWTCTYNYF